MACNSSIAAYVLETREAVPVDRIPEPLSRPLSAKRSQCSESFHVHYSALTVLRDIQTMTSGGKNIFHGGLSGIAKRTKLHRDTVRVAMNQLLLEGWLVLENEEWRNGQGRQFKVLTHDQFVEKYGSDSCR